MVNLRFSGLLRPERRRRRVGAALLLLFGVAAYFAVAVVIVPGMRQNQAVRALEAENVGAAYDVPSAENAGWYERLAGLAPESWIDYFYNVNLVIFPWDSENRQGIDVELLTAFPRVGELNLSGCSLSADQIAVIGGLKDLRILSGFRPMSDESVAKLAGLKRLWWLSLDASRLSDDGIARLASLPKLQWLELDDGRFSGSGLAALQNVTFLWLADCDVGDGAIEHISRMRQLRELRLAHTCASSRSRGFSAWSTSGI